MRILGLDVGEKRIGVAVSDEIGLTAQGLTTIVRSDIKKDIERLAAIVREYSIRKIIVGLPRNMNGTYGPQAGKTKEFVRLMQQVIPLEVVFWDERLTTTLARRTLLEGDVSRKKRKKVIDRMAAVMILQGFLDRNRSGG